MKNTIRHNHGNVNVCSFQILNALKDLKKLIPVKMFDTKITNEFKLKELILKPIQNFKNIIDREKSVFEYNAHCFEPTNEIVK